jgi:capsular polysaccharide biosynthesis protein
MRMSRWLEFVRHACRHPYALMPGAPAGIINSARDWVADHRRDTPVDIRRGAPAEYWEIDPPTLMSLPAPNSIGGSQGTGALRIFPTSATALCFLKGARVLGSDGVVISPDNRVFAEFTYVDDAGGIDHHSIFRRRRFPPARKLPGWYATLCYPSSAAYFHWIVESLPRVRLLQPHLDKLDGIFVPGNLEPQILESLYAMSIRKEQIVQLDMASHYQPEHLLVPSYCAGLDVPEWVPSFLRSAVLGARSKPSSQRRLYISRGDAGKRRVTNESEICALLQAHGFEIVRLRELDFRAQAALFDDAEVVIGPHGAGLANVVFCRPGTKVLELLPSPRIGPHVYYSLTAAALGQYWMLHGQPAGATATAAEEIHMDFSIDPQQLAATLKAMAIEQVQYA